MKIGWGYKITILYTAFVVMMLTLVFMSVNEGVFLVTDNYYEKDLKYNEHIEKLSNTKLLTEDITVAYSSPNKTVTIQFPDEISTFEGNIQFFRPSDDTKDFDTLIETNDDKAMVVNTTDMINGLWKMKIDWQGDGKKYYKEEVLVISQP